jgi:membrane associated rhomboid family serine protease
MTEAAMSSPLLSATVRLRVTSDARRLEAWALALRSHGVVPLFRVADGLYELHVSPADLDAARGELDATDAEDAEARRAAASAAAAPELPPSQYAPLGGLLVTLLLLVFFVVTGPSAGGSAWFPAGTSDATRVLHGEWWRTITALTLHADSGHVLSNVAIGGVVVAAVMRRLGVGWGVALVVAAGALGNLVNAWAYGSIAHRSVGFSTAVFGAIGILGGLTYISALRPTPRGRPAWTAIGGSLALLAMLGASERSDLLAHLFGTATGLGVGLAAGYARWRPGPLGQWLAGLATLAVIVGAWLVARA